MSLGFPLLEMEECFQPHLSASAEVHTPGTQPALLVFVFFFQLLSCMLFGLLSWLPPPNTDSAAF